MKFRQVILLVLSFLIVVLPSLVVESSSLSDNNLVNNITRGSSFTMNDTSPYWLSPSGNIAFGFHQLPLSPGRYVVGIWFVKSPQKTLVWNANPNALPLYKPSSILFTNEGKLVLRTDNTDKFLLPNVPELASYAKMQDDGNFVLYGSDSQIVWQSFDYPTDTILGGQKLKAGTDLISNTYRLSVTQTNGFVAIYKKLIYHLLDTDDYIATETVSVVSEELDEVDLLSKPVILSLDVTGKLYLASYDDEVVKVFYQDKRKQKVKEEDEGDYIYRATLSSIGRLNLHKERIDGNDSQDNHQKSSFIVWSSSPKTHTTSNEVKVKLPSITLVVSVLMGVPLLLGF